MPPTSTVRRVDGRPARTALARSPLGSTDSTSIESEAVREVRLRPGQHAGRLTRKLASEWLQVVDDATAGNAALLAGELVTALQRQSRLSVTLRIDIADDEVLIRVIDDTCLPSPMAASDAGALRLQSMLERACTTWGCIVGRTRREMWAALPRDPDATQRSVAAVR